MRMTMNKLKHSNRRPNRRERLAEISLINSKIADDLIKEARRLARAGQEDDASRLVDIVEQIVDNNKQYQNMVGEVLHSAG